MPSTIFNTLECRYFKKVTILCIDRTNNLIDESWVVVCCSSISSKFRPRWIDSKFIVLTTTVYCSIVLVDNIFTLLTVRLNDEFLHLLNSQVNRNYACNTEECTLKDCIGTVTKANLLSNLSCVDVVNFYIVVCKVFLNIVRKILSQLFTIPYCVQKECTVLAKTTSNIVHVQVSLYVTCNKVRSIYKICRVDRSITKTKV